jgi:hypothetical protein
MTLPPVAFALLDVCGAIVSDAPVAVVVDACAILGAVETEENCKTLFAILSSSDPALL